MNANVGMRYPVYAPVSAYTAGTGITYGTGAVAAEAVSASLNSTVCVRRSPPVTGSGTRAATPADSSPWSNLWCMRAWYRPTQP